MKIGLVVLGVFLLAGAALAGTISPCAVGPAAMSPAVRGTLGNPYDEVQQYGSAAQDFETAYDAYDIWVVSDFTTSEDYYCETVSALGFTNGGVDGVGANFHIYDGLPWAGGSIVMSASGGYDTLFSAGLIGADFGHQLLPAGSYYMVFQSVREFGTSGQSYIYQTSLGNNNDYQWNPGAGFGFSTTPILDADSNPIDVNWQLVVTPEPSSLLLIAVALLLRRR